jgi:hypothetical protein
VGVTPPTHTIALFLVEGVGAEGESYKYTHHLPTTFIRRLPAEHTTSV